MTQSSPAQQLRTLMTGHFLPRCLHVVAELGVADYLNDTPLTADELARSANCDANVLARMLRLLAVAEVFAAEGDCWRHTELSRQLRSDHPQSMRAFARMIGSRWQWAAAGELEHSLRTGQPAFEQVAPGGIWRYFAEHPDEGRIFDAAMTAKAAADTQAVLRAFDFGPYPVIADIGGGRGHVLAAVLDATPQARGILFDLPDVAAHASATPRIEVCGGDFFLDALPHADAYILCSVLHDWADDKAVAILRAVRQAAGEGSKLLVLEAILPEAPGPHASKVLDIIMLGVTGGRERTQSEYALLLEAAGFRLERVVPTDGVPSVVVGRPI